jgi:succinate dehydrogenase/fumarate reductase cytochrome b subunit
MTGWVVVMFFVLAQVPNASLLGPLASEAECQKIADQVTKAFGPLIAKCLYIEPPR